SRRSSCRASRRASVLWICSLGSVSKWHGSSKWNVQWNEDFETEASQFVLSSIWLCRRSLGSDAQIKIDVLPYQQLVRENVKDGVDIRLLLRVRLWLRLVRRLRCVGRRVRGSSLRLRLVRIYEYFERKHLENKNNLKESFSGSEFANSATHSLFGGLVAVHSVLLGTPPFLDVVPFKRIGAVFAQLQFLLFRFSLLLCRVAVGELHG